MLVLGEVDSGFLVYCVVGKDWMGIFCVLVLCELGVDYDIVCVDYELINIVVDYDILVLKV